MISVGHYWLQYRHQYHWQQIRGQTSVLLLSTDPLAPKTTTTMFRQFVSRFPLPTPPLPIRTGRMLDIEDIVDKQFKESAVKFASILNTNTDTGAVYRATGCIVDVVTVSRGSGQTGTTIRLRLITTAHGQAIGLPVKLVGIRLPYQQPARVAYVNTGLEMALIECQLTTHKQVPAFDWQTATESLRQLFGHEVMALGFPDGGYQLCTGLVNCPQSLMTDDYNLNYITFREPAEPNVEHTTPIYHGFSGGPLIDLLNGQLVGINFGAVRSQRIAVSVDNIQHFMESADTYKHRQLTRRLAEHRDLILGCEIDWDIDCLIITNKFVDYEGNRSLDTDDLIDTVNGQPMDSVDQFAELVDQCLASNQPTLTIKGTKQVGPGMSSFTAIVNLIPTPTTSGVTLI
ncbi:uncharacterized protein LOC128956590 [Oppia nitens]|uniref:uncharacterized protein LOC128956590 n=1 Tax=Oppia nitens TaxID=1686743 RepID=UPI0023DA7DA9|nr:uncharacterized protein LOC128956590 [Oppia nitens]